LLYEQNSKQESISRYRKSYALLTKVKNTSYAEMLPQMDGIFIELESRLAEKQNN